MKKKATVGIFGKLHGLKSKLNRDLQAIGFTPFEIDTGDLAHPPGTVAVICTISDQRPNENHRGPKELSELSLLIESLKDDQVHLIFVSIAGSNRPETLVTSFGHLDLQAEELIRGAKLPYTIVRTMNAEDRPGRHHKIFWRQDLEGVQKGEEHAIPWEDLSQILVNCVNRDQVLSKTFTVHAVSGDPVANWDLWFRGMNADPKGESTHRKTA